MPVALRPHTSSAVNTAPARAARERERVARQRLFAEPRELRRRVQHDHAAHARQRHANNRQRPDADQIHLLQESVLPARRRENLLHRIHRHQRVVLQQLAGAFSFSPKFSKNDGVSTGAVAVSDTRFPPLGLEQVRTTSHYLSQTRSICQACLDPIVRILARAHRHKLPVALARSATVIAPRSSTLPAFRWAKPNRNSGSFYDLARAK